MVAYFVLVIKKSDKSIAAMFWIIGQTTCYTLLKTIVEKSNLIFLAKKTATDLNTFKQDAAQMLMAQKSDTSNLELPKKHKEVCEAVPDLVERGLVQEALMGAQLKRRLAELKGEEEALVESGRRPTPARYIYIDMRLITMFRTQSNNEINGLVDPDIVNKGSMV